MNQTFNFQRFLLINRLEIAEKGRTQLLMAAVLVGALLLMMLPIMFSNEHKDTLSGLHTISLVMLVLFGGSLYTNQVFGQYDSTNSAIAALMVPASRLEKFLSTLLLNLAFIIPFFVLYLVLHFSAMEYANNHLLSGEEKYELMPEFAIYYSFMSAIVIQGVAFLGAIYFTKAAYIKTAAVLIVVIGIGTAINNFVAESMTPSPSAISATPFMQWRLQFGELEEYYYVNVPEQIQHFVNLLPILILLSLWYIAYIRLVEKEV
ncbi:hypothetical protein [Persicitalea sp.]|uniref:hypothetical protein n=1 Tax=Persicitalea sp. TaxID=3100273 RepID=UPI0035942E92